MIGIGLGAAWSAVIMVIAMIVTEATAVSIIVGIALMLLAPFLCPDRLIVSDANSSHQDGSGLGIVPGRSH